MRLPFDDAKQSGFVKVRFRYVASFPAHLSRKRQAHPALVSVDEDGWL